MYGNLHLPPSSTAISITEFKVYGGSSLGEGQIKPYQIPGNATFLYIFLVGAGSGGGRPNAAATTTGAGGGGGSPIVSGLFPTMLLPKTLFVRITDGGIGATTNNTIGGSGWGAFIYLYPPPTGVVAAGNKLLSIVGRGGGSETGTGGSGGTAMVAADAIWSTLGLWTSQVGVAGANGAASGNGSSAAFNAILPLTGGAGGGVLARVQSL